VLGSSGAVGVRVATRLHGWNVTVAGTRPLGPVSVNVVEVDVVDVEGTRLVAKIGLLNTTVTTAVLETLVSPEAGERAVLEAIGVGVPPPWAQLGTTSAAAASPSALSATQSHACRSLGFTDICSSFHPPTTALPPGSPELARYCHRRR
jgi:hypothetical protein